MKSLLREGLFITFEGGEGAGKSTLIEEMAQKLAADGYEVLKTREPGGTKLGEHVRQLLLQHSHEKVSVYAELCLFLASRAQHISEVIGPALEARKIVLCDRFNDSSVAYQGAARGLGMEKVAGFCDFISQGLQPHLTLYLDIDPEIGLNRAKKSREQDRIESEALAFHSKIREGYHFILKKNPQRFHLLDAEQPPKQVFSEAMKRIHPILAAHHV
jgi:dTMP kinase